MENVKAMAKTSAKWLAKTTLYVILIMIVGFCLWTWITLTYVYSKGERAGYLQKFSKKGWLFKTWEGELAMVNLPGAMPEVFHFSTRSDEAAQKLQAALGQRVVLKYDEHRGIPTTIFAETPHFATDVDVIQDASAPK